MNKNSLILYTNRVTGVAAWYYKGKQLIGTDHHNFTFMAELHNAIHEELHSAASTEDTIYGIKYLVSSTGDKMPLEW